MSRFIEANRKRFEAMRKPLLVKREKIKTKTIKILDDLKAELAAIDAQLDSLQRAEQALINSLNSSESQPLMEEPITPIEPLDAPKSDATGGIIASEEVDPFISESDLSNIN